MSTMDYYGDLCKKNEKNCDCVRKVVDSEPKTIIKSELESSLAESSGPGRPIINSAMFLSSAQNLDVKAAKNYIRTYFKKHVDFGSGELRTTEDFLVGSEKRLITVPSHGKDSSFPHLPDEEKIMAFRKFYKLSFDYIELARFIERKFSKQSHSGNRLNLKPYKAGTANRKFCHGQRQGRFCTIYYEFQGENLNNSSVIQQALCLWSKATNINFVETLSEKKDKSKITFIQNEEKWSSKFSKKEFRMKDASGFSYPPKRPYRHNDKETTIETGDFYGKVYFNPSLDLGSQTGNSENKENILYEVLHRIGHAIGLGFSNDPSSVMYIYESVPLQNFFESAVFDLPEIDQKTVRNLYGGKRQESFMWNNFCSDYF